MPAAQSIRRLLMLAVGMLIASAAKAQPYTVLEVPQSTGGEGVEVREFFSYGCPHCRDFEPQFSRWAGGMGERIEVVHTPVTFGRDSWRLLSRAYYAGKALGILDTTHGAMFEAIHDEGRRFRRPEDVAALFAEVADVTEADALAAIEGFAVGASVNRAERLVAAYGVRGTPAVGVAGRYLIDVRAAGGQQGMLEVAERLVEEAGDAP